MYVHVSLFILTTLLLNDQVSATATLSLGELTFDKIISKFPAVLVKFDVAFPYGEKYEVFKKFAKETYRNPGLLLAEVGVKDYGEKENEALAMKYNANKDDFPVLKLFVQGKKEPVDFPKKWDFSEDNLRKFVKDNSDIYLGLIGCLESYDRMAKKFMETAKDRNGLIEKAEKELTKLEGMDAKSAKTYVLIMKKINETGEEFIDKEMKRVQNLLKGKLASAKQTELTERLNILKSFVKSTTKKEEL